MLRTIWYDWKQAFRVKIKHMKSIGKSCIANILVRHLSAFLFLIFVLACFPPMFVIHFMYSLLVYPMRVFFVAVSAVVWTTEQTVLCYHYFLREPARAHLFGYFSLSLSFSIAVSGCELQYNTESSRVFRFLKYRWSWMHTQMHMHPDMHSLCVRLRVSFLEQQQQQPEQQRQWR